MTFPAPHFIQNRNHFRAASPIRRGWPVMLAPSDPSRVVETTSATDAVIGIADAEAPTGGIVEIAWIGFVDVALAGAALGAEVRLAADGSPTVGGDGRFIGIAGGASFGGYTVTRLGLLGYLPAAGGGGGGGSDPIPIMVLEATEETFQVPESAWKHSVIIMPNEEHQTSVVRKIHINLPNEVAEPGYQFTQFYMVIGESPESGFLGLGFNDGLVLYSPEQIPYDDGVAAFEILWTYAEIEFMGAPMQGWMPSVTISSVGTAFSPLVPGDWVDANNVHTVADALNQLAERITALGGA